MWEPIWAYPDSSVIPHHLGIPISSTQPLSPPLEKTIPCCHVSPYGFVSSRIPFNVPSGNREQLRHKLWILLRRDLFHLGVMESFLCADWTIPQVSQAWESADSSYLPFSPAHVLLHRLFSQAPKSQVLSLLSLSHHWAQQTNVFCGQGGILSGSATPGRARSLQLLGEARGEQREIATNDREHLFSTTERVKAKKHREKLTGGKSWNVSYGIFKRYTKAPCGAPTHSFLIYVCLSMKQGAGKVCSLQKCYMNASQLLVTGLLSLHLPNLE